MSRRKNWQFFISFIIESLPPSIYIFFGHSLLTLATNALELLWQWKGLRNGLGDSFFCSSTCNLATEHILLYPGVVVFVLFSVSHGCTQLLHKSPLNLSIDKYGGHTSHPVSEGDRMVLWNINHPYGHCRAMSKGRDEKNRRHQSSSEIELRPENQSTGW